MPLSHIERDWEVFAGLRTPGVGAVRQIAKDHLTIYVEGFGDAVVTAEQISEAHDGKVMLDMDAIDDTLRDAIARAHDAEPR